MQQAKRIQNLPPYLFAEIDKKIEMKKAQGVDVISLGIGDPVEPTPAHIVEKFKKEIDDPKNHQYPSYYGLSEFRVAIASWYKNRFNVDLDPDTEVLPLIGSKEGIAHIFFSLTDEGDVTLAADPGYPVYTTGAILSGAKAYLMPLLSDNDFNPDLNKIPGDVSKKAKLMFLNYPNNPTSAVATPDLFTNLVDYAKENDVVICHDNAYSEITFDGYVAPSFLETSGAKDVGVEFHSLSKTYNMTGWRCGFAVGNAKAIEALGRVKTNIDSGIFDAIQKAGIEALHGPQDCVEEMCSIYAKRRDKVIDTLASIDINIEKTKGTIYVWIPVPEEYDSEKFTSHILEEAGVVVSPGNAFGPSGEGYIRMALTVKDDRLEEALDRIKKAL